MTTKIYTITSNILKMNTKEYVIGIDYGTDSVRVLIVNALNGDEVASTVKAYPRWATGKFCDSSKDQYRQHPLDSIEAMEYSVQEALKIAGDTVAKNIAGISFDTTGSTPVLVNENGIPLSLTPEFEENPNAMFILWKDHTSIKEASEINQLAWTWKQIIPNMKGESILRNGFGQKYFMRFVPMKKCVMLHFRGSSIATGCRHY
jgi:L-ribulokinase